VILSVYLLMCLLLDARRINPVTPDTHTYVQPAENLLAGHGFVSPAADGTLHPEFLRTPVYPLYLAAFVGVAGQKGLAVSVWFQRIAWGLIITLGFPGTRKSILGKALCLLSPQTLVNASLLMSDLLFACLVALGLRAASRAFRDAASGSAACAGLLLGLATLTRPVGKLLPIALIVVVLLGLRRSNRGPLARTTVAFLIAASVLPLGWSARNWQLSGHFDLSPLFGANLSTHRKDLIARMVHEGASFGGSLENRYAELVAEQGNALSALVTLETAAGLDQFAGDAVAARVGIEAVRRHPILYARDSVYNMVNIVMAPADAQMLFQVLLGWDRSVTTSLGDATRERVWSALAFQGLVRLSGVVLFLLLPVAVCFRQGRREGLRLDDTLHIGAAFYFVVVTSLVISTYGRYLLPVLPSLAHTLSRKSVV
jgi:4-amino-4-deoxy-L-arabinose transferase-like glycosyltransferase